MKLRKLHIEDYKMFKDFDISFVDEHDEALPIVVLAGVNGSGKTTLLEYMRIKNTLHYIDLKIKIYSNTKTIIKSNFHESYDGEKEEKFYAKESELQEKNFIETDKSTISIDKSDIEDFYKYFSSIIYFKSGMDDTKKVEKEFVKYWYNQVKFHNKRNDEITKSLQEFITESFNGLDLNFTYSYIDEDDNIFFQNDNNEKFKISKLSTGEQTLLSKVLYLFLKEYKEKVILIDEPELSLHPSWQNKILKTYENFALKNNCQIIIATHSPHIIGSAKNEYLRFLRKDDEGNIEVVDNITAYGRDIEWILEEMGVADTRLPKITKRFEEIQELINSEEFDKADDALDKLEYVIGDNDRAILALRNDLAFERMDFEEDK